MNKDKINELLTHSVNNVNMAVRFLTSLQNNEISPISSGIDHLDKMALGGLLPDLIVAIVSRSGNGKSYTLNNIRTSLLKDKNRNIGICLYNLEMPFFTLLLLELKKILKKPLKWIISNPPNSTNQHLYRDVVDAFRDERLTKIDETVSPEEFYEVTKEYIERNKHRDQLFIMIDHIGIIKGKNKTESIAETMEHANRLKLEYPGLLTFIVLGQLNREIEARWRNSDSNPMMLIPDTSSVFGSDSILFFADIVLAQVIPQTVGMTERYASVNKTRYEYLSEHFVEDNNPTSEYIRLKGSNRIYYHYLKVRMMDGEPTMYCELLDHELEELIKTQATFEKNIIEEDDIEF